MKAGESPQNAVMREAQEETGLGQLELRAFLGTENHDLAVFGVPEIQQRHFFHLEHRGAAPPTWQHYETDPSEGEEEQILFEFSWAVLPDGVPKLHAGQDALLPALIARLTA
jgi:8-oxo-dGTP pyrophosphatase MutT (NUDIX family)